MGLISKIKNVLFEEEEIEIPVFKKEEKPKEEVKEVKKVVEPQKIQEQVKQKNIPKVEKKPVIEEDNERETFKSEPTFQFPVFDEEDFEKPIVKKTKPVRESRTVDFGRFETKKKEVKEEKKKFVPSPIISPVHGIRDKNYNIQSIISQKKEEEVKTTIDVDTIRRKAFGTLEEEIETTMDKPVKEFYEEKPLKSINELLIDSVDDDIDLQEDIEQNIEDQIEDVNFSDVEDVEQPTLEVLDKEEEVKKDNLDDTLESDLFNLIDSMYMNEEGGK